MAETPISLPNYKSACEFVEAYRQAHVYNSKVIDQYTVTHAKQYSIALYNLIPSYNIPREFYRSVVNIVNNIIRDGGKLGNQTIMMPDVVKNFLYKTSPIVGHQYAIQLACLPNPKSLKILTFFLRHIVDELLGLSKHGLIVRKMDTPLSTGVASVRSKEDIH
ncbi:hypothetical protein G6F56_013364 [Rhizopus delemar]|nr:hypothetical protein G6F56_013364 [Rhizopus delemar]